MTLEFTAPIRCYDGCFDSATQRVLDAQEKMVSRIRAIEPEAHVTYFPVEQCYSVHVWGREIAWASTRGVALERAYERLVGV